MTAVFFVIFHFLIPPLVHVVTKNSWLKVPAMVLISVPSAVLMAYVRYFPFWLFVIWLIYTRSALQVMAEPDFMTTHHKLMKEPIRILVYRVACYTQVVATCVLSALLQIEAMGPDGSVPLWRLIVR